MYPSELPRVLNRGQPLTLYFVTKKEFTKMLRLGNTHHVAITESVIKTIKDRFPNLQGEPVTIDKIRVRADDSYQSPVTYYYGFFEKTLKLTDRYDRSMTNLCHF